MAGKLKKFLNYALKRKTQTPRPIALITEEEGGVTVHATRERVEGVEHKYAEMFFGKGRKRWYLNKQGEMLKIFRNTEEGKTNKIHQVRVCVFQTNLTNARSKPETRIRVGG